MKDTKKDDLLIRRLRPEDADAISLIQEAITKQGGRVVYYRIVEEDARKKDRLSFVAESKGKVVGYMIAYVLQGGFGLEKSTWIGFFGVDPKHMGSSIGTKLAAKVLKASKKMGITNVFTSVRWDSTDLLSFFKSLGFCRSNFINLEKILD